jgi:hypothetical protein
LTSPSAATRVHVFRAEEVADVAAARLEAIVHALEVGFSELRLDNCDTISGDTKRVA